MEESYILNDIKGENKRKLGRKEKQYIEKKEKEKEKEKIIKKKKEDKKIKEKIKEKKKEEEKENKEKEKRNENIKIPKLFNKNLKSKRKRQNDFQYSEENSKINIINTSKDGIDIINDDNIRKENKQKSKKLKLNIRKENQSEEFENNIIKAYEKLSTFSKKEKNNKNEDIVYNPDLISCLKLCEKKLRNALNILKNNKNILLNRNIMDKLSRLTEHDKININYEIGNIYMTLMKRGNILNYRDKNFEINDLVFFTNKVIQFKDILINTKNGIFYKKSLIKFLNYIINEVEFEPDQLKIMKQVIEDNKNIEHKILLQRDFDDVAYSISEYLIKQNNIYEQYNILIQNKKLILDMIKKINIKNKDMYPRYLEFGRTLSYLFFNKSYRVYLSEQTDSENEETEENNELFGFTMTFFDGHKNKGELNFVNSENYLIEYDDEIEESREKICDIIINFANKFINLKNDFPIQYIVYILIKRIYFSEYKNYEDICSNLLAQSLINLCFFEESIDLADYFINKIIKSNEENEQRFKNSLIKKIKKVKNTEGFLYNFPLSYDIENNEAIIEEEKLDNEEENINNEEEEKKDEENNDLQKYVSDTDESQSQSQIDDDNYEDEDELDKIDKYYKINSEILFLLEKDLKIGFFNIQNIRQGEKYNFYEEINNSYGILDFCMYIKELDINIKIIDLTEGRVIFQKKGIDQLLHCPFKLVMFFTNPRILKFEIDNSFSWFTSKTIKYKTNILYPENPYSIGHKILLNNYKNEMVKDEKIKNKKKAKEEKIELNNNIENLLITKIDGENKVFNCDNVKNNLKVIKQMMKNKELNIYSIYLEIKKNENEENISNFYYNDKEKGFIKNKLDKETFENYVFDLVSKSNTNNLNIINLYVINGDLASNEKDLYKNYNNYSIKKILGFEPIIKIEGIIQKILFVVQNLNQVQILYYLYKQKMKKEELNNLILLNYTKDCGYQKVLYKNGDITLIPNELIEINKNKSLEENIDILINGIKSLKEEGKNINILLTKSIDQKEILINPENIEKILNEKIENNNSIKIDNLNSDFNKEIEINSHVFYLDN